MIRVINDDEVNVPKEDNDDEQHDPNMEEEHVAAICTGKDKIAPILL